jgi:hypothetical protein
MTRTGQEFKLGKAPPIFHLLTRMIQGKILGEVIGGSRPLPTRRKSYEASDRIDLRVDLDWFSSVVDVICRRLFAFRSIALHLHITQRWKIFWDKKIKRSGVIRAENIILDGKHQVTSCWHVTSKELVPEYALRTSAHNTTTICRLNGPGSAGNKWCNANSPITQK